MLHDTLASASPGWYSGITATQQTAYRIANPATNVTVNLVTLLISLQSGSGSTFGVQVCSDGPGGTIPNFADCSGFTAIDPVTSTMANVRFQGSKSFTAGNAIWVVAKSQAAGDIYRWAVGPGPTTAYITSNSGATWALDTDEYALKVEEQAISTPASIPTTTESGLLLMSALLVFTAWIVNLRKKA
ncbi:hypothetical protein GmRootA79_53760 (plasmid) [Acidovorax sp. A79]